jgi:hypothetical protein
MRRIYYVISVFEYLFHTHWTGGLGVENTCLVLGFGAVLGT